jgi:site-specific DNA-adenine methylase
MAAIFGPLKWHGGKKLAIKDVVKHFPDDLDHMVSVFAGGCSIELYMAAQGVRVDAYDADARLVNFFKQWEADPARFVDACKAKAIPDLLDTRKRRGWGYSREAYNEAYDRCHTEKPFDNAVNFWIINRCNMHGKMNGRGYTADAFTEILWDYMLAGPPKTFNITHQDWETTLRSHPDEFMFIDPPYVGKHGIEYGEDGWLSDDFNRMQLDMRDHLYHRGNWIMTNYNDNDGVIYDIYKDFPVWHDADRQVGNFNWNGEGKRKSKEVIIFPR